MKNEITIIILIFEEELDIIYKCLNSVKNFEIIIIDNSNDISRKEKILEKFKIYKYFLNDKNLGFGKGNNIGIKNCNTKYLLILNPDCVIPENTIFTLQKTLEKYPDCFISTPTLIDENNNLTQNASAFPEISSVKEPIKIDGDICCQSALGAVMFCRTDELKRLGMFDENFFIFFEDDDLCKRIRLIKRSVIQLHNVNAIHQHGQGQSVKNSLKRLFIVHFNMTFSELYYFYKNNNHHEIYDKLRGKIMNYTIKFFTTLFTLRLNKSIFYISKIFAFLKFKKFLKKII
jgi:GT2 family glycosyltransferase